MPEQHYPQEALILEDFTQFANTQTGVMETVLEHVVPRNEARMLLRAPGRLNFGTLDTFSGDGSTTDFALLSTLVRSRNFPQPARAFVGGVEQTYTSAAAPGAGEFTVTGNTAKFGTAPANAADNTKVYYAFADGDYTVEVFSPNERQHDTYANGTIRRLNSAPQDDVNSVWAIGANTPPLPQDTIIRVQVKVSDADSIVNFDADNIYTRIELPFTRLPLAAVQDPDAYLARLGA